MHERYTTKEKILLGVLVFLGITSLFVFFTYYKLAFPEHNIEFTINRNEATHKSEEFAKSLNLITDDFKRATVFHVDEVSKSYLEREIDVTTTADLATNEVKLWYFTTRFFKPLHKEEYTVSFLPNGRFVGFVREFDEAMPGNDLTKDEALNVVNNFLETHSNIQLKEWRLISDELVKRPNRTDHLFIYENRDFRAKDATYRIQVGVAGDQIHEYEEFLKVPESWYREFEKQYSQNILATSIAEAIGFILFIVSIIIIFFIQYRRGNIRFRLAKWVAGISVVVYLLIFFNEIPIILYYYNTTQDWGAFLGIIALGEFINAIFIGASVFILIASGEAMYRSAFPAGISPEKMFTRKGLFSKSMNTALLIGSFVGIILLVYQVLYYFLGKQIGFWSPSVINYSDITSTLLPWLYPLFYGFQASVFEEGIFRLFGISFLKKFFKNNWVPILITAIVWAFIHSTYPQSPWFVRGIEITVIGIVFGILFVRFGILASFTAHYTMNALLTLNFFLFSNSIYIALSNIIITFLPLILAIIILVVANKKGFFHTKDLENHKEEVISPPKKSFVKNTQESIAPYTSLSKRKKFILIALTIIGLVTLAMLRDPIISQYTSSQLGRTQAQEIAFDALRKRNIIPEQYNVSINFVRTSSFSEQEYVLDNSDYNTLRQIYLQNVPTNYWIVRLYQPLDKQEYYVRVLQDKTVYSIDFILDEQSVGSNLTQEEALVIAQNYLSQGKGYDLSRYTLVESSYDQKENRTDHAFLFESMDDKVGQASFRTNINILGEKPSGYRQFLNIPEEWEREQEKMTMLNVIALVLLAIIAVTLLVLVFREFLKRIRKHSMNWRMSLIISGVVTSFLGVIMINNLSTFYFSYPTSLTMTNYILQRIFTFPVTLIFWFFLTLFITSLFCSIWREQISFFIPKTFSEKKSYVKDALLMGYTVPIIAMAILYSLSILYVNSGLLKSVEIYNSLNLASFLPALSAISEFFWILGIFAFFASLLLIIYGYIRKWLWIVVFVILTVILFSVSAHNNLSGFFFDLINSLTFLLVAMFAILFVLRKNLFSYILLLYVSVLSLRGYELFTQNHFFFQLNGMLLFVLIVLPIILYFLIGNDILKKINEKD